MNVSNEFLVECIKSGEEKYIPDLWLRVRGFIASEARKQLSHYPEHYQGEDTGLEEDMIDEAFFSFNRAIRDYDHRKGKFITYLGYKIKPSFNRVLSSYTNSKKPLNSAISLDVPLNEEENIYLSDTISDIAADDSFTELETVGKRLAVRELLESVISEIDNTVGVEIILCMYEHNCGFTDAVRKLYSVSYPTSSHKSMYLRTLEQIKRRLKLKRYAERAEYWGIDEYICFGGCGLNAFNSHQFTSVVEGNVIKKITKEEYFIRKVCG